MESDKPTVEVDQQTVAADTDDEIQELLPLFRLLLREPPEGHDFDSCPICKRHGITNLEASS